MMDTLCFELIPDGIDHLVCQDSKNEMRHCILIAFVKNGAYFKISF